MNAFRTLTLATLTTLILPASLQANDASSTLPDEPTGMKSIFNGKDLSGWDGDPRLWTVKDGVIYGETTKEKKAKGNTFLIWKDGETKDFDLRLSFQVSSVNNSGIQYRSKHITDGKVGNEWVVRGYQHEIRNSNELPSVAGFIYEEGGKRGRMCLVGEKAVWTKEGKKELQGSLIDAASYAKLFKVDDWNEVAIIAMGDRILHYLNGTLILDCTDQHPQGAKSDGVLALQLHGGAPMWTKYKDIRFGKLDAFHGYKSKGPLKK